MIGHLGLSGLATLIIGTIAINIAFIGVINAGLRRQFIAERKELDEIRRNSERSAFTIKVLADLSQEVYQLASFAGSGLRWIGEKASVLDVAQADAMEANIVERAAAIEKAALELTVLQPESSNVVSAAQHLSERHGDRHSQKLLHWRVSEAESGSRTRRQLDESAKRLDRRIDDAIRQNNRS